MDTFAAGSTYNWNGSAWENAIVVEAEQVNSEEITAVTLIEEA